MSASCASCKQFPACPAAVYRVLRPGAHMCVFGGTRSAHRMVCAIEDAGFEIRDTIAWLYGSGFPKSQSVPLALDKMQGITPRGKAFNMKGRGSRAEEFDSNGREFMPAYEPVTEAACKWDGWGTALKPAIEIICLARKPLGRKTVAANVLKWGTGALNIDGCRIPASDEIKPRGSIDIWIVYVDVRTCAYSFRGRRFRRRRLRATSATPTF